jgi:hypothetical protein
VKASISMSLDGFIAGPSRSKEHPLTGGNQVAFVVGAIFALAAAGLGAFLLRALTTEAMHGRDEPVGEPAPCCAFTVGDQGVPEHQPEPA